MSYEVSGTVQSIRLLWDIVQANKSLTDYNKLVAAVSEVNADLISAQAAAIASQKNELTLTQRVRELEQEVMALKNWEREAERYLLTEIAGGTYAYRLKPGMENGEPPYSLCTHCFGNPKKEPLQAGPRVGNMNTLRCVGCNATFFPTGTLRKPSPPPEPKSTHDPNDPRSEY